MRAMSKLLYCLCLFLLLSLPAAAQNTPQALPDSVTVVLGAPRDAIEIPFDSLLANDTSATGGLSITAVGTSAHGQVLTFDPTSGKILYPIPLQWSEPLVGVFTDTFEYTISDGSLTASSYVTMRLFNHAPVASDVVLEVFPPSAGRTNFAILLGGSSADTEDCDDEADSRCSLAVIVESPPACGTVTNTVDGVLFTATDAAGSPCPDGVYLIPYHVVDFLGASSNTAFFHIVHSVDVGEVLNPNASLDTVVLNTRQKQWLPANFRLSGSLMDAGKVKTVNNPLYESSGMQGENPLYCGKTDHLRASSANKSRCACKEGWGGADCGLHITNIAGGTLKFIQTITGVSLTDLDTLTLSYIVNAHTSPFDTRTMRGKIFVQGTDIVFDCPAESRTLAHEAAHVVQQRCSRPDGGTPLENGARLDLKFVVTYKTGSGKGKVSFSDLSLVRNGDVGFSRPGDVMGDGSVREALPFPSLP